MTKLLISVPQAAEMARISVTLARRYTLDGTWPVVRVGAKQRGVRVHVEGLRLWAEQQVEGGTLARPDQARRS